MTTCPILTFDCDDHQRYYNYDTHKTEAKDDVPILSSAPTSGIVRVNDMVGIAKIYLDGKTVFAETRLFENFAYMEELVENNQATFIAGGIGKVNENNVVDEYDLQYIVVRPS